MRMGKREFLMVAKPNAVGLTRMESRNVRKGRDPALGETAEERHGKQIVFGEESVAEICKNA